jgi:hypothetical protein
VRHNPFPGLRTFGRDGARYFFGRDREITDLLERLNTARVAAVVGSSGCGKSSLVFAGLLPALERGFLTGRSHHWKVVEMRPGGRPITALARAFAGAPDRSEQFEGVLRRSTYGLTDVIAQSSGEAARDERLLLITDQFEELFTFAEIDRDAVAAAERRHFVDLLLAASAQLAVPVYWLLTMRSEYLGRCGEYAGLAHALNRSQYLVPNLTREQRRTAIEGPLEELDYPVAFAPILVQQLLNDSADERDQLPLLQHCLMRTFDVWSERADASVEIGLDDYRLAKGFDGALNEHGRIVYDAQTQPQKILTRKLFRAITRLSEEGVAVRRPTCRSELEEIIGVSASPLHKDLDAVITCFAAPENAFITVSAEANPEINLTHECLARKWDLLVRWIKEEAEAVASLRELQRRAGRKGSLYGRELREFERRRATDQWTAAWAARNGTAVDYPAVERFLNWSWWVNFLVKGALATAIAVIVAMAVALGVTRSRAAVTDRRLVEQTLEKERLQQVNASLAAEREEAKEQVEQARRDGNENARRQAEARVQQLEAQIEASKTRFEQADTAFQKTLQSAGIYSRQSENLKSTAAATATIEQRLQDTRPADVDLQARIVRLERELRDTEAAATATIGKANTEIESLQKENAGLRTQLATTSASVPAAPPLVQLLVVEQNSTKPLQIPGSGTVALFAEDIKQADGSVSELYLYASPAKQSLPTLEDLAAAAKQLKICRGGAYEQTGTSSGSERFWCYHVSKSEVRQKGTQTLPRFSLDGRWYRITVTGYVVNTFGKERLSLVLRSDDPEQTTARQP